jgi:hypothetical protein
MPPDGGLGIPGGIIPPLLVSFHENKGKISALPGVRLAEAILRNASDARGKNRASNKPIVNT